MLLMMLTAAAMTSCQTEEERKDEKLREELRSVIPLIEKEQQENIEAQMERVKLHEKLKLKRLNKFMDSPLEKARKKLEEAKAEKDEAWQKEIAGRIDEAKGMELQRIALEMRGERNGAYLGKQIAERDLANRKDRIENPNKKRWPYKRLRSANNALKERANGTETAAEATAKAGGRLGNQGASCAGLRTEGEVESGCASTTDRRIVPTEMSGDKNRRREVTSCAERAPNFAEKGSRDHSVFAMAYPRLVENLLLFMKEAKK